MTIYMVRDDCTDKRTLGTMVFPDGYVCQTLEDPVRPAGVKVMGNTAIPSGTLQVTITRSKRFQKMLPLLNNVPGFGGVRIHPGNGIGDTAGCVLVGTQRGTFSAGADQTIIRSREAMEQVQRRIAAALANGEQVWLDIVTPRVTTSETFDLASADAPGFPS
jgi:hypothetical protein